MHSHKYLLKEVEDRLVDVQKALCACETEKCLLNKNLISIKQTVEESFKRHIGTLQCRAKWLVCHADSLFHLKEGSLAQQEAELELISNELKSCLDASDCSLNKSEDIKMMAKNVLQNASKVPLQPCESGSMSFVAHDDKMEETIICFGDIDVNSVFDESSEYDLLTDEGIVVVGNCENKQAIEMEVKSIQMHHLTAQSANSEKEDFERIEMEMQPVNTGLTQSDSVFEEETDSSKSDEWLHPSSVINPIVAENIANDFNSYGDVKSEKKPSDVSDCTDKVPLWLMDCEETNPWIRHSRSTTIPVETITKTEDSSVSSKDQCIDNDASFKSQKRNSVEASLSGDGNEESSNLSHISCIARASNSKFLRIDIENINKSVYSLDSALNSMGLENQPKQSSDSQSTSNNSTNIDHFDGIFEAPSTNFLRADTSSKANSVYLLDSKFNRTQLLDNGPGIISDSPSESIMGNACSTLKSNIHHINQILDTPQSDYLVAQDISNDHRVITGTYIKPTNAVKQMRILENQPDKMFLRRKTGKTKRFDPAMCEWLRGSSADRCVQCFDFNDCSFNSNFNGQWIKTATDW